jgi:hypothetical protein
VISLGYEVGSGKEVSVPLGHTIVTGQTQKSGKTTALEAMAVRCTGAGTGGGDPAIIAFVTKRGERSFQPANGVNPFTMDPYFVERTDWRFVSAMLESAFGEKMKFERAWIVRACKGARSLIDVRHNAAEFADKAKRSMDSDIYMLLGEYLDEVLPDINNLDPTASTFLVGRGVNVMNLIEWRSKMQMLFIASTLSKVALDQENTVVIVPESWETLPERRNTPVKEPAVDIARKGAAVGNYLWLDSQDTAAVSKEIIRQSSVWLLGVQRESNEVKRTLAHIPAGLKKPKANDVARLELGQFFVCTPDEVTKTYVRPAWMSVDVARRIATGQLKVSEVVRGVVRERNVSVGGMATKISLSENVPSWGRKGPDVDDIITSVVAGLRDEIIGKLDAQQRKISELSESVGMLMRGDWPVMLPPGSFPADIKIKHYPADAPGRPPWNARTDAVEEGRSLPFRSSVEREKASGDKQSAPHVRSGKDDSDQIRNKAISTLGPAAPDKNGSPKKLKPYDTKGWTEMEEELYQKFKARFVSELRDEAPKILRVLATKPELDVTVERKTVTLNGNSLRGRFAILVQAKFFDEPKEDKEILKELYRRGGTIGDARNYKRELGWLAENGFLTVEDDGYRAVQNMKINLRSA